MNVTTLGAYQQNGLQLVPGGSAVSGSAVNGSALGSHMVLTIGSLPSSALACTGKISGDIAQGGVAEGPVTVALNTPLLL